MFEQQAIRLLREQWPNPTMLAEELFAILSNEKLPLYHEGPITLAKGDDEQPGLSMPGFGEAGDIAIDISGDTYNITIGESGLDMGGRPITNADVSQLPLKSTPVFSGRIISGTGAVYKVLLSNNSTVTVSQLQIDDAEKIPAGTMVVPVIKVGNDFQMQVPVWLDDLEP